MDYFVLVGAPVDEDAEIDADLVGGKPYPVGRVHGRREVGDKFEELGVEVRDRSTLPVHDGFAPSGDGSYGSSAGQRAHVDSFRPAAMRHVTCALAEITVGLGRTRLALGPVTTRAYQLVAVRHARYVRDGAIRTESTEPMRTPVGSARMSDVNKGDDDPGASTVMFQRFVDDGRQPAPVGRTQRNNRPVVLIAAAAALLVVLLVIVLVVAVVGS